MKEVDYPAGHSMNTNWFAVDKDGNIAFFNSSDSGMVAAACQLESYFDEFLRLNSKPLSKHLREFTLSKELVDAILSKCTTENLRKITDDIIENEYLFFTGFFVLAEGYNWEDLQFEKYLENEENNDDFIIQISYHHRLYYIEDIYGWEVSFKQAIKAGMIISCVESFYDISEVDFEKTESVHFGLYHYEYQYGTEPYLREYAPKHPLNVKHLSQKLQEDFATFNSISFEQSKYLQPYEFLPCNTFDLYRITEDTPYNIKEAGYAMVTLSDNKSNGYCKIFLKELIVEKISLGWSCGKCEYLGGLSNSKSMIEAFIDYPSVFVIDTRIPYRDYDYITKLRTEIINRIGLSIEHCYITSCIKCVNEKKEYDDEGFRERFDNCYQKIETEFKFILPSLIICVGETTFNLLKGKFQIKTENFKAARMSEITIDDTVLPILLTDSIDGNHEKLHQFFDLIPKLVPEIPIETSRVKND